MVSAVSIGVLLAFSPGHATSLERERGDIVVALRAFDAAFKAGDGDAGFHLGRIVELGMGVEPDIGEALKLYRRAAKHGSAKALNRLGALLVDGQAVAKDLPKARKLFCEAAKLGDADGAYNCASMQWSGIGGSDDKASALKHYRGAAEADHVAANVLLGRWYVTGDGGEKRDLRKALYHFERAASRGNPIALYELGRAYAQGRPVAQDLETAQLYYVLAAMRGSQAAEIAILRGAENLQPEALERVRVAAQNWRAREQ